ncbi:MAG: sulfatase/phosphatase domain-containing protein, partial [Chthoniobacteraceae bacterium]
TWPARLRAAGYFGGHIGKVHVSGQDATGYDFWAGRGGYAWLKDDAGGKIHSIQKDTDEALRFLNVRRKDKPFFLQVAYTVPHAEDGDPRQYLPMPQEEKLYTGDTVPVPETATAEAWEKMPAFFHKGRNSSRARWQKRFDTPEKYQTYTRNYYRLVSGMDRSIGVILDQLKAQGIADNTIVVFTGDNGYFLGEHGLADKWYAYEESLRVPLVVRDPRLPEARRGQRCDDWVLNVDFAPTFCAMVGLPPPAAMQGRDFTPLLQGRTPGDWRTDFLYQFKYNGEHIPASESVCSKDWKYIKWLVTGTEELFDLRGDAHEMRDLSKDPAYAADLARLRARYDVLKKEIGGTPVEKLEQMPFGGGAKPDVGKGARNGKGKNEEEL